MVRATMGLIATSTIVINAPSSKVESYHTVEA